MLTRQLQSFHRFAQVLDFDECRTFDKVPADCASVACPEEQDQNEVAEQYQQEGVQNVQLEIRD